MKIQDDAKPSGTGRESNDGEYTQEDLEEMLEAFIQAKHIEKDPKLLAMLKDYATSHSKMVEGLFDDNSDKPEIKSLKDVKKLYNDKVMAESED